MASEPAAVEHVRLDLPRAFRFLFDPPLGSVRYRVARGGRDGAKSWSFARALLIHGLGRPLRILCAREYQSSIGESVHYLLADQIGQMGLDAFYTIEKARIYASNGTEFIFLGIKRDPHKVKSTEGVDICWLEEAEAVSEESWKIIIPTIRKHGSEIWVTFNPKLATDPTFKKFVNDGSGQPSVPEDISIIRKVNWTDNPWPSVALAAEREAMRIRDPEAYAHIYEGEPWTRAEEQVLAGRWRVDEDEFEPLPSWGSPYYGADWGFAHDPTVLVRCWVADSRLWIDYDERGVGLNMDEIAERFRRVPGADRHVIRGDSARPETINELRRRGLRVEAAPKWPSSKEEGAEHFRTYEEIVIHPRCKGIAQEALLWRYKRDARTGDILPKIQDGNDHGWDAVRYALAPIIKKRPAFGLANP